MLRPGKPGEPEVAAGHEVGRAPEFPLPPPQHSRISAPRPPRHEGSPHWR
jgi:hypothetical protein